MDSKLRAELQRIVADALELPSDERVEFVRSQAAPELLEEALQLVAYGADSELTRRVDEGIRVTAGNVGAEQSPAVEGFTIESVIGQGGMGTVYRARQVGALERAVALKVIRPSYAGGQFVARFDGERRAIARMAHPNIASVYDAGTTRDGVAWFAMELVEGRPLNVYCDEEGLNIEARLRLFIELCRGVHHAHQRGILHRDLKPSNVLVRKQNRGLVPKIIDFGIAKAIEGDALGDAMPTIEGQIVGTPEYMSPERLRGSEDVDVRADVYSLGVILYELVCGKLPFDRSTTRRIGHSDDVDSEAPRPSTQISKIDSVTETTARRRATNVRTLRRQLRGELDWITLKALASGPVDRYASASELALDIQRHLDGEIVSVGPPSARYRFGKFARKHRVALFAVAAVIVSLGVGLLAANRQRIAAEQARQQAESVTEFLTGMLREVQPEVGDKDVTVRQVLDDALANLQDDDSTPPAVRAELLMTVGGSYLALSEWQEALNSYDAAIAVLKSSSGPRSSKMLEARNDRARALDDLQRFDESEAELLALREIAPSVWGPDAIKTIMLDHDLGSLYHHAGRMEDAEAAFRRALDRFEATLGDDAKETAQAKGGLANVLGEMGETEAAAKLLEEEIATKKKLYGERHPSLLGPYNNLGITRFEQGRPAEAESLLAVTWDIRKEVLGPDHQHTLNVQLNLAWLHEYNGDIDGAEALLLDIIERATRVYGRENVVRVTAMNNLGFFYMDKRQRYEEAERMLLEVIEIRDRVLGSTHMNTMTSRNNLALVYERTGRLKEAEELNEELLELRIETLGPDHPHVAISRENLERVRSKL